MSTTSIVMFITARVAARVKDVRFEYCHFTQHRLATFFLARKEVVLTLAAAC